MEDYTLSNGLKVILIHDDEQPLVTVSLQLPFGRFAEPTGLEGVAHLTAALIQKGPVGMTSEHYSEILESAGVLSYGDAVDERMSVGARMLSVHADHIFHQLWECYTNPSLDTKEFDRLIKESQTALQAEFSDPSSLAYRHFNAQLFGHDHCAGRSQSLMSVKKITCDHIQSFYRKYFGPRGALLVIAGDFNRDEVKQSWFPLIEKWNNDTTIYQGTLPQKRPHGLSIRLIDKPDLTQATFVFGHQTIGENHPLRYPLALGNYCLGGGNFSSRLMASVRSQFGKTYGISSQVSFYKEFGKMSISTTTRNHQVGEVIETTLNVYEKLIESGIDDDEREKACQFGIGHMAFELEGISHIVEKVLWMNHYGYDKDIIEKFPDRIRRITSKEIHESFLQDEWYKSKVLTIVGKRSAIEKQLSPFGDITFWRFRDEP